MKILLINGSLRGDYSSSLKVAHAFVKGMVEEYGADTEVCEVALKDKRIDHCHGCFVCWKTTPGQCCIHDDMDELRQMVMDSDIIVESFPLYFFGLPSKLKAFTDRMIELLQTENPVKLHSYSPSLGLPSTRQAVADSLNKRFGMNYTMDHIFMTSAAASALAHALRCVTKDGDEVITFAPYFPEYVPYVTGTGAKLTVIPADITTFQINFEEFEKALNPNVQAILINSPNNPSGIVYSTATITKLADILRAKEKEYGHPIYLISDEPYREIVFAGVDAPFISKLYENTICCYSFSKSVSLPGERIGYMAVNPACEDAKLLVLMAGQISRFTGHNCPPSIIQMAVESVLDQTSDLSIYETNAEPTFGRGIKQFGGTFATIYGSA